MSSVLQCVYILDTRTHGHEEVERENLAGSATTEDDLEVLASVTLLESTPVVDAVGSSEVLEAEFLACLGGDVGSVRSKWCRLNLGSVWQERQKKAVSIASPKGHLSRNQLTECQCRVVQRIGYHQIR